MTMYNVSVFKNETANLAHVAINKIDSKDRSLTRRYKTAKYTIKKGNDLNVKSGNFVDGFNIMLMNTKKEDWIENIVETNLTKEAAIRSKEKLVSELSYSFNVTRRLFARGENKEISIPSMANYLVINPSTYNQKKFKELCLKLSRGLNVEESKYIQIVNKSYKDLVFGDTPITRYDIWKRIYDASLEA